MEVKVYLGTVKLKQENSQLFYQQNGFIWEQLRTATQDMQLWQTACKFSKAKERKLFYRGEEEFGRVIGGNWEYKVQWLFFG